MLLVLYLIFSHIMKSEIPHFELYILLGITMWSMFSRATSMSLNSILSKAGLVSKVYFPREILPISANLTAAIMTMLEFIVFFAFVIALDFVPPATILFLPYLIVIEFVLAFGISMPISVLNVYYRDVQYIWGVLLHAGFFLSGVFFDINKFPDNVRQLVLLNPMAQIINMGHNAVLYGTLPNAYDFIYTTAVSFGILIIGYTVFRRYESKVAEEL